jgi:hypothetical protein
VAGKLRVLYAELETLPAMAAPPPGPVDPQARTAAVLVAGFGGVGIHTVLSVLRLFPGDFKNLLFLSVGVIDSGIFKGEVAVDRLAGETEGMLRRYVDLARRMGMSAEYRFGVGIDVVAEAEKLCLKVANEFPKSTFFIGKVIFEKEAWYQRLLHNETAFSVQKRLELAGKPMVILPARVQ